MKNDHERGYAVAYWSYENEDEGLVYGTRMIVDKRDIEHYEKQSAFKCWLTPWRTY